MKISADIIEKDVRREEENVGELVIKFKPKTHRYVIPFPDTSSTWQNVKCEMLRRCGLSPESQVSISYIDEENDKVQIDSESEFHEAMRVGQKCGNRLKFLVKETESEELNPCPNSAIETFSYRELESGEYVVMDKFSCNSQSACETLHDQAVRQKTPIAHSSDSVEAENTVPTWLASYISKLKDEVIKEVHDKVMEEVLQSFEKININSVPAIQNEDQPSSTSDPEIEKTNDVLHIGIICDNCEQPVRGIRYKCKNCVDYDLCERCESLPNVHNENHIFLKIRHNVYNLTNWNISHDSSLPRHNKMISHPYSVKPWSASVRNSVSMKNRKERKIMKMIKKIEKYRAKEQSCNSSRAGVPTVAWEQVPITGKLETRRLKHHHHHHPHVNCSGLRDVHFIKDETVPDGTVVPPRTQFLKCWRIRNSGCKPFTSHTVLKYCWGARDLLPHRTEATVPHLQPGQEGNISVVFTSPCEPGHYQSHWRLYHKGHGFGHRMWCNIEVVSNGSEIKKESKSQSNTLNVEEKSTKKQNDVQEGIAQVLTAVREEQQRGDIERKTVILSHTATPTNTPFDLSPPKSPEPPLVETSTMQESNVSSNYSKASSVKTQPDSYTTGSESDDTVSVVNLNSSESETEFVMVPMPMCYNMDIPLVPSSLQQDEGIPTTSNLTEIYSSPSTRRPSTESSPSSDVYSIGGIVTSAPLTVEVIGGSVTSKPHSVSHETTTSENVDKNQFASTQNLIQLDQSTDNIVEELSIPVSQNLQDSGVFTPPVGPAETNTTEQSTEVNENINNESNQSSNNASGDERMVQVLPESLVNGALTAAASVYNTAKAVINGMNNRNDTRQEDWRSAYPPPPPSPMAQLIEMGFFNRTLNHHLLIKHNGKLEDVVTELVANHDNNWYNYRHNVSHSQYQVNFD